MISFGWDKLPLSILPLNYFSIKLIEFFIKYNIPSLIGDFSCDQLARSLLFPMIHILIQVAKCI